MALRTGKTRTVGGVEEEEHGVVASRRHAACARTGGLHQRCEPLPQTGTRFRARAKACARFVPCARVDFMRRALQLLRHCVP